MNQTQSDLLLMENLEEILSTMRHQLGNSVNAIKVTLDVLKENFDLFDDGKKKDYLERGSKLIERQQGLIEAMKSYSRFNVTEKEEINFHPFWEHLVTMMGATFQDSGIQLNAKLDSPPCRIVGNQMALGKVVMSILDNAREALEDIEEPRIDLTSSRAGDDIILIIRDNGCGIRRGDLTKVFIPLFSNKPGRMGMGLPIAKKLLLKMRGDLELESEEGQYTEVRIRLKISDDGMDETS